MDSMNDKVKGNTNQAVGKIKEMAGYAVGNKNLESEGSAQKNDGKAQKNIGELKDKAQLGAHQVGDSIEQAGRKMQEKGFGKTGRAVEKAGDKIEHSTD